MDEKHTVNDGHLGYKKKLRSGLKNCWSWIASKQDGGRFGSSQEAKTGRMADMCLTAQPYKNGSHCEDFFIAHSVCQVLSRQWWQRILSFHDLCHGHLRLMMWTNLEESTYFFGQYSQSYILSCNHYKLLTVKLLMSVSVFPVTELKIQSYLPERN